MSPHVPVVAARRTAALMRRLVLNPSLPWTKQRARMERATGGIKAPKSIEVSTDVVAGVPVEVLSPIGREPKGTLVHLHGGGFTVGSPAAVRGWAGALADRLGIEVVVPDYRLAPEHPFPAGLDDTEAVVADVLARWDPATVALSGDSAGANLALVAVQDRIKASLSLPAALVLLSPWLDLTVDRLDEPALVKRDPLLNPEWLAMCAVAYAAGHLDEPRVSPLLGDVGGLPPTLVQGGSDDILAPDAARLSQADGVTLSVASPFWHDFSLQVGQLAAAEAALEVVIEHLERTMAIDDG